MPAVKTLWNEHVWQRLFKSRITFCDHYSAWNVAGDMIIPEGPHGTSCNRATKLCGRKQRKICPVQCALSASPYMIVWQTLDSASARPYIAIFWGWLQIWFQSDRHFHYLQYCQTNWWPIEQEDLFLTIFLTICYLFNAFWAQQISAHGWIVQLQFSVCDDNRSCRLYHIEGKLLVTVLIWHSKY